MKDSYSFDVDDAGLDRSYGKHREAYIKTFDRLGLDYVIVSAMSGAMGGSKSEEFLQPTEVGEDTFVRCTNGDYAANVEAVVTPVPPARDWDGIPAAHVEDTPDTPTIETLVALANERFPRATAVDGRRHPQERRRHPGAPGRPREPLVVGVPGDREVDVKRLEAAVSAGRGGAVHRGEFEKHPALAKGYIGPGVLGEKSVTGIRYLLDPRVVTARPGSPVRTNRAGTCSTWSPAATSPRTASSRPPRSATATPARSAAARSRRPAASRSATSSSSAASTPRRSACKVLDENGKLVTVTMGSYGIGVTGPSPRSPRPPTTSWACAGRARSPPPTSTSSRPARTTPSSRRPSGSPESCRPPASGCCTTTGRRCRPG